MTKNSQRKARKKAREFEAALAKSNAETAAKEARGEADQLVPGLFSDEMVKKIMQDSHTVDWDAAGGWHGNDEELLPDPIYPTEKEEWKDPIPEVKRDIIEGWPWEEEPSRAITMGPLIENWNYPENNSRYTLPEAEQTSLLLRIMEGYDIIATRILINMADHYSTIWKFSATSRLAWRQVLFRLDLWITNLKWYNNCNLNAQARALLGRQPGVNPIIMVTPMRTEVDPLVDNTTYQYQIKSIKYLCRSINNFADYIKNIQFHRVPFLDINILALLIPKMRHLTNVGVYKCQLIHIGNTMRLLEILKTDRPLEKEHQVYLDFYPNHHNGPPFQPGNPFSIGGFGPTWDNWNGNSPLAVWQLVSVVVPQAKAQGINLTSPHTAFRKWLDDGPCWRVEATLAALLDPSFPVAHLCALLDAANPTHHGNVKKFTGKIGNRHEGWEWATKTYYCDGCQRSPLGIFFGYQEIRSYDIGATAQKSCWGCRMVHVLENEKDHLKHMKRAAIRELLTVPGQDGELNTTDLKEFLKTMSTTLPNGEQLCVNLARRIQERRGRDMAKYGNDREFEERQTRLQKHELNMYGSVSRTPLICDKLNDPINRDTTWDLQTVDRAHQIPFHR